MLSKMASMQPGNVTALAEWATRAFDLPRPPSKSVLYDAVRKRAALAAVPEGAYGYKKVFSPVVHAFERALVCELEAMEKEVKTVTDNALLVLAKHIVDKPHPLPVEKRPEFSKG
ncbi:hypothetical protein PI125_g25397, partial [Phytophthora idaei]